MRKLGPGPVRCLLVRPEFLENTFYNPRDVFRLLGGRSAAPPLGLLTVAAHLPAHWELRLADGDVAPITDAHLEWADVLMISGKGPQEVPICQLIERAHRRDLPVVVGGAGPTLQPSMFAGKADYVVAGEAEPVLSRLLADLENGISAGVYRSTQEADLSSAPVPRYDLAPLHEYCFVGMNFSRGCPFSCEFCAQKEIFGNTTRCKAPEQILREHQTLYDLGFRGMIDFGYDNLIGDIPKAERVLEAMLAWNRAHGHPFCYSTEATMNLARQRRVLELMRDNDFRYIFMGIESGDEKVLERTKKGQNVAMPAAEAVRIVNSYGMVVNTGLIFGFDGESAGTAPAVLNMVQETGAFPTLVLPLHALPGTALARRMEREGRLFKEGRIDSAEGRTDTATTGLNFVTDRPRAQILGDLAETLEALYTPANHYRRLRLLIGQLGTSGRRFRPPLAKLLKLTLSFARIVGLIGFDRRLGLQFWKSLAIAAIQNRGALEAVIGLQVMNANYARQSRSYVKAIREQILHVDQVGEQEYNRRMGARTERAVPAPTAASPGSL
ncbi:MAG: B12-binding domain-containing radical SAM protein [Deltaproteobacteria bacterium]|nr:B12-binding domain-containing radical SAM protein [Deltaproteobacteria bacterium]